MHAMEPCRRYLLNGIAWTAGLDVPRGGVKGSPIWLADNRISTVAGSSIDRARVQFDRGEMSFAMFDFDPELDAIAEKDELSPIQKLEQIRFLVGDTALPEYLLRYVDRVSPSGDESIAVHKSFVPNYKDADYEKIERVWETSQASDAPRVFVTIILLKAICMARFM